ncbi:hypothetical protein Btru_073018 [Bulinus truncatus]|nr:hypothetical protein Btru_073018 [Bulinus truncatus]
MKSQDSIDTAAYLQAAAVRARLHQSWAVSSRLQIAKQYSCTGSADSSTFASPSFASQFPSTLPPSLVASYAASLDLSSSLVNSFSSLSSLSSPSFNSNLMSRFSNNLDLLKSAAQEAGAALSTLPIKPSPINPMCLSHAAAQHAAFVSRVTGIPSHLLPGFTEKALALPPPPMPVPFSRSSSSMPSRPLSAES